MQLAPGDPYGNKFLLPRLDLSVTDEQLDRGVAASGFGVHAMSNANKGFPELLR
jgi:hypothetical protein